MLLVGCWLAAIGFEVGTLNVVFVVVDEPPDEETKKAHARRPVSSTTFARLRSARGKRGLTGWLDSEFATPRCLPPARQPARSDGHMTDFFF